MSKGVYMIKVPTIPKFCPKQLLVGVTDEGPHRGKKGEESDLS